MTSNLPSLWLHCCLGLESPCQELGQAACPLCPWHSVPTAGLLLHPLTKPHQVHGSCMVLCAEQGKSRQGDLSKDSLRGRYVSNVPTARFCSPGRATRHHFTCQHPLTVRGCLEHGSEKDPVLREEVPRSASDVCIGNRERGHECQELDLWVYFPTVTLKPLVKSHLKEPSLIALQEIKRE